MQSAKSEKSTPFVPRKGDDIADRLLNFAVRIGKVDALPNTRLRRHIAAQLVRSGTSPAPHYAEACGAESLSDFTHKLAIALEELRETRCWIQIIMRAELLKETRLRRLLDECEQFGAIIAKSIVTAKARRNGRITEP